MTRPNLAPGNRQLRPETGMPIRLYERDLGADAPAECWEDEFCGTYAGYQRHRRNKDPQCKECSAAHREYMREWRLRTGRVKSIKIRLTPAQLALLQRMAP